MFKTFVCFAVKEGSSELGHCDFMDSDEYLTFTFSIGTYTSPSYLVLPQLGFKIELRPGDCAAFLARRLVHFATRPTDGRRVVFTCFVDRYLVGQVLKRNS